MIKLTKIFILMIVLLGFTKCSYNSVTLNFARIYKRSMTVEEAVEEKIKLDKIKNPALKYVTINDLKNSIVRIDKIKVKKITTSNNIDYDFCIIGGINTKQGEVECYIYTKDIDAMADIKAGKTYISATGYFGRFFTLLDDSFVKIEVLKSEISNLD